MLYLEPRSLEEVRQLLTEYEDASFIAGGATSVAMMNADLIAPDYLIGLHRVSGLRGSRETSDAWLIGATTTHTEVAADSRLQGPLAVVRKAAAQIAHPAIRNVGTIGGAICHGDPNSDYPGALVAANAKVHLMGPDGEREVPISEFFLDYMETAVQSGELVTAVSVPRLPSNAGGAHLKVSRVDGDYAIVSVSAVLGFKGGRCNYARVAIGSCGPGPIHLDAANQVLIDGDLSKSAIEQAGNLLIAAADPIDDVRGSSTYRCRLIPRVLARVVQDLKEQLT